MVPARRKGRAAVIAAIIQCNLPVTVNRISPAIRIRLINGTVPLNFRSFRLVHRSRVRMAKAAKVSSAVRIIIII